MSWHYQIQQFEDTGQDYYMVVEVYTHGARSLDGIRPMGETPQELINDLQRMLDDVRKYPVLKKDQDD